MNLREKPRSVKGKFLSVAVTVLLAPVAIITSVSGQTVPRDAMSQIVDLANHGRYDEVITVANGLLRRASQRRATRETPR